MELKDPELFTLKDRAAEMNLNIPILVEGKHDVDALREIGFKGHLIKINRGVSLDLFAEMIARNFRKIILLTDFDRKGQSIKARLQVLLSSYGCEINLEFWDFIYRNYKIKSVEDIPWLMEKVLSEATNSNGKRH